MHPCEAMHFVGYGNFTDKTRQVSRYSTRTYERYLKDVDDWEFRAENIAAQFGDLTNLNVFNIHMEGYSAYLNNIYMTGTIEQSTHIPYRMEIDTEGDNLIAYGETKHISCKVFFGWEEVPDERIIKWTITRDSGDATDDEAWQLKDKVKNFRGEIDICLTDAENDLGKNTLAISTLFKIVAEIDSENSAEASLIYGN